MPVNVAKYTDSTTTNSTAIWRRSSRLTGSTGGASIGASWDGWLRASSRGRFPTIAAPVGILFSLIRLVVKRTINNLNLVVFTIIGLIVAVSLVSSVPLYSDAIIEKL